jgi:hypothetical protein
MKVKFRYDASDDTYASPLKLRSEMLKATVLFPRLDLPHLPLSPRWLPYYSRPALLRSLARSVLQHETATSGINLLLAVSFRISLLSARHRPPLQSQDLPPRPA